MSRNGRLGLGTVQFGLPYGISNAAGQVPPSEAAAILEAAEAAGIAVVDTAAAYGTSEDVLGQLLRPAAPFKVVTKTLPLAKAGVEAVVARARQSARTLGDLLDTVMIHAAADLDTDDGARLWEALIGLKREGVCRRLGISAYADDAPLRLARRFHPDVMQVPVSLLDQRLVQDGTLAGLKSEGVEVHARSVFLQGLLFLPQEKLPPRLAHAGARLADITGALDDAGVSRLGAALSFVLDIESIDVVVVGVTQHGELQEIIEAARQSWPSALDGQGLAIDDAVVLTPSLW